MNEERVVDVSIEALFSTFPKIETERLMLRQMEAMDAMDLHAFYANKKVTKHLDWHGPASAADSGTLIESWNQAFRERRLIPWGISLREQPQLMGTVILMPTRGAFDDEHRFPLTLGYDLRPDQWNKGIMTEALRGVIDFTKHYIHPNRIQAEVVPDNQASIKLLSKLGFQQEGLLRQYLMHEVTHKLLDVAIMALLMN